MFHSHSRLNDHTSQKIHRTKFQKVKLDTLIDRKPRPSRIAAKAAALLAVTVMMLTVAVYATVPVFAASGYVEVTGGTVNVRSGAGTSYSVIGRVYKDEKYACLGEKKDTSGQKWYNIQLSASKKGWITGKYARSLAAANTQTVQKVQITGATVNVRSGCGTGYQKLGVARQDDTYDYLGSAKASGGTVWYKITFSAGREGWVSGKYSKLITAANSSTTASTTTTTATTTTTTKTGAKTTAATATKQTTSTTATTATTTQSAPPVPTATVPVTGKYVKITSPMATAHVTPGHSAPPAGEAAYGKTYPYIESYTTAKKNIWFKVRFNDNTIAWIAQTDSQLIDETFTPPSSGAQASLDRIAKKYGAVGVQVAVIKNGAVTNTYQYGYAVKNSVPMASDSKIRIASISKVVVGMNAMKMQEDGIVKLDEDIGTYWLLKPYKKTTLRDLLTHTSYLKDNAYVGSKSGTANQLRSSAYYRTSRSWMYNNYGIGLAGATLEVASGQRLNAYADKNFFAPLGIDASFTSGDLKNPNKLAVLYYPSGNVSRSITTGKSFHQKAIGGNAAYFTGGLTISARDMAKLTAILANDGTYDGTRYLSKDSVALMEQQITNGYSRGHSFKQCMPLRYQTNIYGQKKLYYHLGTAYGTLSFMGYNPDTKNGVVVISTGASNTYDSRGTFNICADLAQYFLNS